jgi:CheY-like chemotaxis protein
MKPASATQVLMIDDDEDDALLVRHMAGKMPGPACQVHWAGSYDQGIKALGELDWDICLVDYRLGARTGLDVVAESRARGIECPFLLVSGAGSHAIDVQATQAGVMGYLEKGRLCPLELERAIRYAIGVRRTGPLAAGPVSEHVPSEVVELLMAGYASKLPFVVISLTLDREAAFRNHFNARRIDSINSDMEALMRSRISEGEALIRTKEDALLLISSSREPRDGRQFLSLMLSEPLAISSGDGSRTVSLQAMVRRNVFTSDGYPSATALVAELDGFIVPGLRQPGPDFKNF